MEAGGAPIQSRPGVILDPWAPRQVITAARLQAMQDEIKRVDERMASGNIEQGYGKQNRPLVLFVADEQVDRDEIIVKATRIGTNGERQDEAEQMPKGAWYRINRGDVCTFIVQMTGEAVLYPIDPVRHLYFQQNVDSDGVDLDMPANAKSFWATHVDDDFNVIGCHVYSTAGTYSVTLTINGTAQADTFTGSTAYPFEMSAPYKVTAGDALALLVNSSSGVKGFEAVFSLRKGYINTIGVDQ